MAGLEPVGHCAALGEEAGKQPRSLQQGNSNLNNAWGIQWGDYLLFSEHIPERQCSWRHLSGSKGTSWCHFPPLALRTNREPPVGSSVADTGCLVCLHQQHPLALQWSCLLSHSCLSSSTAGLTSRRPAQAPAHTMSPYQIQEGLSSIGGHDRSYFTSTPEHT